MAISNILTGWGNYIKEQIGLLSPQIKQKAEERLLICDACPMREHNTCVKTRIGKNIETGLMVKGCGCNLAAKSMDPNSECPLAKWKKYKVEDGESRETTT